MAAARRLGLGEDGLPEGGYGFDALGGGLGEEFLG